MYMNMSNDEYGRLADRRTPDSPILKNCICAFVIGGLICTLGQCIINLCKANGMSFEDAASVTAAALIFLSALLTGLDIYKNIAKFAGAGTLVPITGFANAVVAPAIEFRSEGLILGMGAKMFVIAGPVIVYGTLSSVIAGIIYFIIK